MQGRCGGDEGLQHSPQYREQGKKDSVGNPLIFRVKIKCVTWVTNWPACLAEIALLKYLSLLFFFFGLPFPNEFKNGEGLQVPVDCQALFSLPCTEQGNYLPGARLLMPAYTAN